MGCDIHIYREKFEYGEWVSADQWSGASGRPYGLEQISEVNDNRNYDMFGALAKGVRTDVPFAISARGLPENASHIVKKMAELWDGDGHNHSWLTRAELIELRKKCAEYFTEDYAGEQIQGIIDSFTWIKGDDFRIVFWFDN